MNTGCCFTTGKEMTRLIDSGGDFNARQEKLLLLAAAVADIFETPCRRLCVYLSAEHTTFSLSSARQTDRRDSRQFLLPDPAGWLPA